jgi:hypothetical protein
VAVVETAVVILTRTATQKFANEHISMSLVYVLRAY